MFVAAHTSAGKTVVAEYAIALARKNLKKAIYTSPIKALSNQKYREFKTKFGADNVGILTGDVCLNPQANCLIVTTEVLQHMLYKSADMTRDIDWVVFDEVHYVNDDERGFVWEETIIMLPDHISLVMLSATVPNYRVFAQWVGTTKRKVVYVQATEKRPVPLEHSIYFEDKTYLIKGADDKIIDDEFRRVFAKIKKKKDSNYKSQGQGKKLDKAVKIAENIKRREDALERLIKSETRANAEEGMRVGNSKESRNLQQFINHLYTKTLTPAIIFCFSRVQCETYASSIATAVNLVSAGERSSVLGFYRSTLQRLKAGDRKLPQIRKLKVFLQAGIGVHHAGMLPILKETVEILFSQGLIKVLFATTTFAMGVNMPARTVAFLKLDKRDNKGDLNFLDSSEYLQMAGRAGRRGKDDKGTVIIYMDSSSKHFPKAEDVKSLLQGKGKQLESKFKITYNMILHLLQSESVDIMNVMHFSFGQYATILELLDMKKQQKELQAKLMQGLSANCKCESVEEVMGSVEKVLTLNKAIAGENVQEIKQGRLIGTILYGCISSKAIVVDVGKQRSGETLVNALILFPSKPSIESNPYATKQNFSGTLESGEYYELAEIPLKYISCIYNYSFKQDLNVRGFSQARSLAERLSSYLSKNKVTEVQTGRKSSSHAAQRKELWTLLDKRGNTRCPHWFQHFQKSQANGENKASLERVNSVLSRHNLEFMQDYQCKLKLLQKLNYIDERNCLLIKGKVAREISGGQIVLLTELVFSGRLRDLAPEEFAAIVSVLVSEEKRDKGISLELSEKYNAVQAEVKAMAAKVFEMEVECGVYVQGTCEDMMHFGLAPVIYNWVQGMSFSNITELTTIHEGSIIRGIMRVEYILREVKNAAGIMGDSKLKEMCVVTQDKIKRDIIFTPSLYIQ